MAQSGKREPKKNKKKFDTDTPLSPQHLRAWAEHLAGQLENSDSVEITLGKSAGQGRKTVSYQVPANPSYNICPLRRGEREEPAPRPKPGAGGSGSGGS